MSAVQPMAKSSSSGGTTRPVMSVAKKVDRPVRPAGPSWVDGSGGVGDRPLLSTLRRSPMTEIHTTSNENSVDTSLASVASQQSTRVRAPRLNAASVGRQENTAREIQEMNLRALASYATRRPGERRRSSSSNIDDASAGRGRPQRDHSAAGAPPLGCITTSATVLPHHSKDEVDSLVRAAQLPTASTDDVCVPKRLTDAIYGEHDRDRVAAATPTQLLRWRSSTPSNVDPSASAGGGAATPMRRTAQSTSPYRSVAMSGPSRNTAVSCVSIRSFSLLPLEVSEVPRIARPSRSPSPVVRGTLQRDDAATQGHDASIPSRRMPTLSPPRKPNPHSTAPSWGSKRHTPVARTKVPDETITSLSSSSSDPDSPPRARSMSPLAVPLDVEMKQQRAPLTEGAPLRAASPQEREPTRGMGFNEATSSTPRQVRGIAAVPTPTGTRSARASTANADAMQRPSLSTQVVPKYCWSCGGRHPDGAHGVIRFCCLCGARVL